MTDKQYKKLLEWVIGDDYGLSSQAIVRFMLGIGPKRSFYDYPADSADRGRCIRLLNLVPEWWDRLDEMKDTPKARVYIWRDGKLVTYDEGWEEQIPLIKKERYEKVDH